MPKGAVDIEDGGGHLFRRSALKDYMAGSRRSVLPSYTGKRFICFLWAIFFVFILSLVYLLFSSRADEYNQNVFYYDKKTNSLYPGNGLTDYPSKIIITFNEDEKPLKLIANQDFRIEKMNPGAEIKSIYSIEDESLYVKLSNNTIGAEVSSGYYPVQVATEEVSVFELFID
ncbi:hypothetical protein [Rothia aerolata]|uniref:Uncharacterized protein n=1 Tax=Rothia aerolata TaxID=1812262 RepID=A0A917ING2_9MICC|nr:hypothetical protein [Rothia aerolata]GGH58411.1 hypothetical protein GCM10007359_04570 [Rothia aerolata]